MPYPIPRLRRASILVELVAKILTNVINQARIHNSLYNVHCFHLSVEPRKEHGCHLQAKCVNSIGSYRCVCNTGWEGNGFNCTDANECIPGIHQVSTTGAPFSEQINLYNTNFSVRIMLTASTIVAAMNALVMKDLPKTLLSSLTITASHVLMMMNVLLVTQMTVIPMLNVLIYQAAINANANRGLRVQK